MLLDTRSINVSHSLRHTLLCCSSLHPVLTSVFPPEQHEFKQQQRWTQNQREVQRGERRSTRDGSFQRIARGDGAFKSFRFNKCLAQGHSVGTLPASLARIKDSRRVWMVALVKDSTACVIGRGSDVESITIPHKTHSTRAQQHKHKLCSTVSCKARWHFTTKKNKNKKCLY